MTGGFAGLLTERSGTAVGAWVKIASGDVVELLAGSGLDFVVLDMEHAPLDLPDVHRLLGAARGCGLPALVRVPDHRAATIARVLDSGADGVLVPHVDSVEQAHAVVDAARLPPRGSRGFGPTVRAGHWGHDVPGYRASGEQAVVVAQIESGPAVALAERIAAVDGLDALLIGPSDLSVSTGLAAGSRSLTALLDDVRAAARRAQMPLGTAVPTAHDALELPEGHAFVVVGSDATLLRDAATAAVRTLLDGAEHPRQPIGTNG
ncbi:2,4-dihydroxyhept-2-ene-1,7-dioic acid aldolase [Pseudonocardia sp. ICBG1122]|nr:2,4-dihydroxyhept-2-ene-1,7-dioic acid aldolase [Pseudonocardia pini]